jgi:hypothetical protein
VTKDSKVGVISSQAGSRPPTTTPLACCFPVRYLIAGSTPVNTHPSENSFDSEHQLVKAPAPGLATPETSEGTVNTFDVQPLVPTSPTAETPRLSQSPVATSPTSEVQQPHEPQSRSNTMNNTTINVRHANASTARFVGQYELLETLGKGMSGK